MKKIWILFAAAVLAVGCSDNKSEEGGDISNQLTLSAETLSFFVDGTSDGDNAVTITSDGEWRLTGYESWCTPSATSGKSGDKVTFTVAENPSNDARSASYTFIRGNKAVKLVVSQLQNSVFETITSGTYAVNSLRQTITFIVRTSFGFDPEINAPWIANADAEQTRGVETHFLRFVVDENVDYSSREGKVYVTGPDGTRYELTIAQNQKNAVIAGKKIYDVDASGETITISLDSNVDYTVSVASGYSSWIQEQTDGTRGLTPSQKIFKIAASAADTRQGQIVFKYSPTDGSPAVADTVLIAQRVGQTEKVTVPDANFRYFLRKNDYVLSKPGEAVCEMTAKGKTLTSMSCGSQNIASLEGIEAFAALTTLTCNYNNLTEIDLSANTALTSLNCGYNRLSKLNLANCAALRTLTISYNPIEELILNPGASVTSLSATSLRTSDATVYAPKLKVVGAKLTSISCYNNRLEELDVTGCPAITTLSCYGNQLTKLDVAGCVALKTLNCYNNQLEAIDLSSNSQLTSLSCYGNGIKDLNLSANPAITTLSCYANQLKALDLKANPSLTSVSCYDNALETLDVSANVSLTSLNCYNNKLDALNLASNVNLTTLNCYNNRLEALELQTNAKLTTVNCYSNKLKTLDVSENLKITTLNCSSNPDMTTLYMAEGQTIRTLTKDEQTEIIRK